MQNAIARRRRGFAICCRLAIPMQSVTRNSAHPKLGARELIKLQPLQGTTYIAHTNNKKRSISARSRISNVSRVHMRQRASAGGVDAAPCTFVRTCMCTFRIGAGICRIRNLLHKLLKLKLLKLLFFFRRHFICANFQLPEPMRTEKIPYGNKHA